MFAPNDEPETVAEIDEALGYLVETLRQVPDQSLFMAIVDELLDKRLEIAECSSVAVSRKSVSKSMTTVHAQPLRLSNQSLPE